uniref:Tubulin-specific chaperone A n=1 Tax=Ditylenchus dipsaci TaxID=166011 RepID=A0A915EEL8_9BILA
MDEYMVKKANEVLQETRNMLPITSANVKKALNELKQVVDGNRDALKETAQLAAADQEMTNAVAVVDA